jgi:acetyl esterase/lipase
VVLVAALVVVAPTGCTGPDPRPVDPAPADGAAAPVPDCGGALRPPVTHRYRNDVAQDAPERVGLDLYLPERAERCPVLVWVHGGGWQLGDKAGAGTATKVRLAEELGAALVAPNHRFAGAGGARWPDMGADVAAAVSWVRAGAERLGLDPDRIVLMGHSSGAHLATVVAVHPRLLADAGVPPAAVRCIVPVDTAAYELAPEDVATSPVLAGAFGDDPATLADASPLAHLRDPTGPLPDAVVVTRGSPRRVAEAHRLADAVRAAGSHATVIDATPLSHREVNLRLGDPDDVELTPRVLAELRRCVAVDR